MMLFPLLGACLLFLILDQRHVDAAQCACATGHLNVRSGAGTQNAILHTMAPEECLTYLGDTAQAGDLTWYHLQYQGSSAWAAANWLRVQTCSGSSGSGSSSVSLPGCPHIVSRAEWGARAPSWAIGDMVGLPTYVFIHHGTGGECFDRDTCITKVRAYQNYHMDSHEWPDIGYNFVVGEDGNVYEARGWREIGAHTYGYNYNGIAICVIGDFTNKVPNAAALNTVRQLIQCGLDNGHISPSYTLKGHRDVGQTACPGDRLYDLIHSWSHYVAGTTLYG